MTRIWTGTAQVVNGYTSVVVMSGEPLSDTNCPEAATVVLAGATYFVDSRGSTIAFELTRPYEGDDGIVSLEIDPLTPRALSIVELSTQITEYSARLALVDANGRGFYFRALGYTGTEDPGPGFIGRDAEAWGDIRKLYIDVIDLNEQDITDQLALINVGDILIPRSILTNAVARARVRGITAHVGWFEFDVQYLGGSGIIADTEDLAVEWRRAGTGADSDDQVGTQADLVAFEGEDPGFRVLVSNYAGGRGAIVSLVASGSPSSWSPPAYTTGADGPPGQGDRFDLGVFVGGRPRAGEVVAMHVFSDTTITFAAGLAESAAAAAIAPTSEAVFSVRRNGLEVATVTFAAVATVGVFAAGAPVVFNHEDVIDVIAPAVRDPTLSDVTITLSGNR